MDALAARSDELEKQQQSHRRSATATARRATPSKGEFVMVLGGLGHETPLERAMRIAKRFLATLPSGARPVSRPSDRGSGTRYPHGPGSRPGRYHLYDFLGVLLYCRGVPQLPALDSHIIHLLQIHHRALRPAGDAKGEGPLRLRPVHPGWPDTQALGQPPAHQRGAASKQAPHRGGNHNSSGTRLHRAGRPGRVLPVGQLEKRHGHRIRMASMCRIM